MWLCLNTGGCTEQRCDRDGDCLPGERCDPETHHCFAPDAGDASGLDGGDGGDAGDAGDAEPECGGSAECVEGAAPICDATELVCRGCGADGECAARDPALPV